MNWADLVALRYPGDASLVDRVRRLTVWAFAYRYPGLEEIAEPEPTIVELKEVLGVIDALIDHLAEVTARKGGSQP